MWYQKSYYNNNFFLFFLLLLQALKNKQKTFMYIWEREKQKVTVKERGEEENNRLYISHMIKRQNNKREEILANLSRVGEGKKEEIATGTGRNLFERNRQKIIRKTIRSLFFFVSVCVVVCG